MRKKTQKISVKYHKKHNMRNNLSMYKHTKFKGEEKTIYVKSGMCKPDQPQTLCLTLWQLTLFCTILLHYSLNSSIKLTTWRHRGTFA